MANYRTMSVGGSPSSSPAPDPSRAPAPAPSYQPEVSYRLEVDTSAEIAARAKEAEAIRKAAEERKQRIDVAAALHTREFAFWCTKHIGAEPDALDASEKALAFNQYTATVESALTEDRRTAVARLEKEYAPQTQAEPKHLRAIEAKVKAAARAFFDPIANLLKSVRVIGSTLELSAPVREKFQHVLGYLRRSRICIPPSSKKVAVGAYQAEGKLILHATRSDGKQVILEFPHNVSKSHFAKLIMRLRPVLSSVTGDTNPLAVIDGSFQEVNFNATFPESLVIRTTKAETHGLEERVHRLYKQPALAKSNTRILNAIPSGAAEVSAVFGPKASPSSWRGIRDSWNSAVDRRGFAVSEASRTTFLNSLCEDKNVIVLVAHGSNETLWFASPQPEGSNVSLNDVREIASRIRENRPTVYLFSCEAASAEKVNSWATVLTECGTEAVIAPQTRIPAGGTRKLLEKFLELGTNQAPITALHEAGNKTGQRYLENWVG